MHDFLVNLVLSLLGLLALQANVFVAMYFVRTFKSNTDTERFVKVQSVADLQALDTYQPPPPPEVDGNPWGFLHG